MSILYYLENFNSYYNRTIKRATDRDLSSFMDFVLKVDSDFNFNPNDHVSTKIVVNYIYYENGIEYNIDDERNIDYILVSEDNQTVKSKWFVTDRVRNLGGQWSLTLRRDLISDYYNIIRESPIFVEKGWLNNSNRLIYNSENMSFNQIKKNEVLLKDVTNTPWIVGYLGNDYLESGALKKEEGNFNVYFNRDISRSASYSASYSEYNSLARLGTLYTGAKTTNQDLQFVVECTNFNEGHLLSDRTGFVEYTTNNSNLVCEQYAKDIMTLAYYLPTTRSTEKFYISIATMGDYIPTYQQNLEDVKKLDGKLVKNTDEDAGNGSPEFFYIKLTGTGTVSKRVIPPVNSNLYKQVQNHIQKQVQDCPPGAYGSVDPEKWYWNNSAENRFSIYVPVQSYTLSVSTEPPTLKCRTSIGNYIGGSDNPTSVSTKQRLQDAPYTMFCMPYYDTTVRLSADSTFVAEGKVNYEMAAAISTDLGGGVQGQSYIYDLQLLPFCPIAEIYNDEGEIDIYNANLNPNCYSIITSEDSLGAYPSTNNCGIALYCKSSSFSGTITLDEAITLPAEPLDFKVANETQFVRLVSPNYAGAFEFKPTSNGGCSIIEFNCTYKPYQPYIHLNPLFNPDYLYGSDWNDNRGLICGGSFSIPQTTEAWKNYQIQNKSYMDSFNRQIENMEINNAVQREREIWSAVAGSVGGAAGGAVTGGYIGGGPIGAAIGGAVGGVAAIAGGIRDIQLADKLRAEALDYTKDQFGYSLQNIKALPNTMSRTSAFDINNKLFPFLEYYGCFEEEEKALKNKLKYNGMTIMVIGYIDEYIRPNDISYFKGQLIRFEGSAENHEIVEIANELNKGVFI